MKRTRAKLVDLLRVKHGYAFKGEFFDTDGEFVLLTPGNFNEGGGFRDMGERQKYYTGDVPEAFVLEEGDVLVAMTEQMQGLLGSSIWIPASGKYLHNQRLGKIVDLVESRLDPRYLYHLFNTASVRHQISASASGTKVRHTAPERIGRVEVDLPSLADQRKIADALSAYDDLIENNRRRMALLEESARLLYQEWFVRLRFPGHEDTRIVGGIPDGWTFGRVADFGTIITGKTPSTTDSRNYGNDVPFVKTPDMHAQVVVTHTEQYLSLQGAASQPSKYLKEGSILVACIGAKLGVVSLAGERCQTNQQINAVSIRDEAIRYYAFFALTNLEPQLKAMGGGATMPNVNKSKFSDLPVMIPTHSLAASFGEIVQAAFAQIRTLSIQNEKLRAARDLLLPRLMSGEVAV